MDLLPEQIVLVLTKDLQLHPEGLQRVYEGGVANNTVVLLIDGLHVAVVVVWALVALRVRRRAIAALLRVAPWPALLPTIQ